ncbi:hypothetical protein CGLO_14354 [Colletotrichum gloeosporioides Cg-14]|nr:hypothetical protein CGLO_14354 [Colletotrichum gloeosporioides Cg-14]
MEDIKKK